MPRKNDNPQFPVSGQNVYKFDKDLDTQVRGTMGPAMSNEAALGIVREGTFTKRRDAQINKRKKAGQ